MTHNTACPIRPSERLASLMEIRKQVGRDWLPLPERIYIEAVVDPMLRDLQFDMLLDYIEMKVSQV